MYSLALEQRNLRAVITFLGICGIYLRFCMRNINMTRISITIHQTCMTVNKCILTQSYDYIPWDLWDLFEILHINNFIMRVLITMH